MDKYEKCDFCDECVNQKNLIDVEMKYSKGFLVEKICKECKKEADER